MTARFWKWVGVPMLGLTVLMTDAQLGPNPTVSLAGVAQARVVVRHTTAVVRRAPARVAIRRSAIYVSALPAGCVRKSYNGAVVWKCGSAYYQAYGGTRYVVVYVN